VPSAPGLGIEVDETAASREEFKFWEAPHLHCRDGSYTNW
jgi:galactonate dehydratase